LSGKRILLWPRRIIPGVPMPQSLFPDLEAPPPRPRVRIIRLTCTLWDDGSLAAIEVIAQALDGTRLLSRTFQPAKVSEELPEALVEILRAAEYIAGHRSRSQSS